MKKTKKVAKPIVKKKRGRPKKVVAVNPLPAAPVEDVPTQSNQTRLEGEIGATPQPPKEDKQ